MTPKSTTGWTFSETMVHVKKPFEKAVKVTLLIGLTVNVLAVILLMSGVIKRRDVTPQTTTVAAPAPSTYELNVPDSPHQVATEQQGSATPVVQ